MGDRRVFPAGAALNRCRTKPRPPARGGPPWCCAFAALGAQLGLACGSSNIAVVSHPQPAFAAAEPVTVMPPPAQVEHIEGTPPAPGCLWADGQWVWTAQRWDWRPGGWIRPPEGCQYSGPTTIWSLSGGSAVLSHRAGRWYSITEPKLCREPASCVDSARTAAADSSPQP